MNSKIYEELSKIINPKDILINEPMYKHTTFRVGGNADFFVKPSKIDEIVNIIKFAKNSNINYYVMGNGSNLLVSDSGFRGIVIQIHRGCSEIEANDCIIKAKAGATLKNIYLTALNNNLSGFEFASGIPGTLGGAVIMNAGAYGGEISHIIKSATLLNESQEIVTMNNKELELGYRTSYPGRMGYIVLEAKLQLEPGNREDIIALQQKYDLARKEKQPLEYPSAGSTFKRPEGYYAGKLIMDSDLAGKSIGGAQVSAKHCGFVINSGNATAKDVIELINFVVEEVKNRFGVTLEPEVKMLGKFD